MNIITTDYRDMSADRCGNKAANLALLRLRKFNVPAFVVMDGATAGAGPDAMAAALKDALDKLGGDRFAVRSSSREEDGTSQSFAGQFDTFV